MFAEKVRSTLPTEVRIFVAHKPNRIGMDGRTPEARDRMRHQQAPLPYSQAIHPWQYLGKAVRHLSTELDREDADAHRCLLDRGLGRGCHGQQPLLNCSCSTESLVRGHSDRPAAGCAPGYAAKPHSQQLSNDIEVGGKLLCRRRIRTQRKWRYGYAGRHDPRPPEPGLPRAQALIRLCGDRCWDWPYWPHSTRYGWALRS